MKSLFLKISILLSPLVFFLIFSEILVRKFRPQVTYSQAVKLSIDCYEKDPLIPFTLAKNHTCRMTNVLGEFDTRAKLNSQGYRGKEFSLPKKEGITRVLAIGDSMTFGWGVADENTYPYLLEEKLKKEGKANIEVINGGYKGGLSLDSYYVYLKNRGFALNPDVIVLGFTVFNDITDLAANIWEKTEASDLPQKISSCCHTVDGHILRNKSIEFKYRYPWLRESHLFLAVTEVLQQKFKIFPAQELLATKGERLLGCTLNPDCLDNFSSEEEKAYRLIEEMQKLASEKNSKFLVVLFPVDLQFYPDSRAKYSRYGMQWYPKAGQEKFINERIVDRLDKRGVEVFDLYDVFAQKREDYPFFPIDAHFNPLGTKLVSESIAHYLLERQFVE